MLLFSRTSIQTDFDTQKDIRTQWPSLNFYLHPSWIPFVVGQFCYDSTLLSCLNIMKLRSALFWLTLRLLMASLSMPTTSWPSQSVALKPLVQLTNLPYKTHAGWQRFSSFIFWKDFSCVPCVTVNLLLIKTQVCTLMFTLTVSIAVCSHGKEKVKPAGRWAFFIPM